MANLVTGIRILCSIALCFCPALSPIFLFLYGIAGISDMADGFIARKTHTESETGAKLDSAADFLFFSVSAVKLLPVVRLSPLLWLWIAGIAVIKLLGLLLRFIYCHRLAFPHSIANKLTGLLLFFLPPAVLLTDIHDYVVLVCSVASVAAVQELFALYKKRSR